MQRRRRRNFRQNLRVVVKVNFIARLQLALYAAQSPGIAPSGDPNSPLGHRQLDSLFRKPACTLQHINRAVFRRLDQHMSFK